MPSYRYLREIPPENQKPEEPHEYSKKEKAKNWWHYHWGWVAGGVVLVALVASFVYSIASKVEPDYTIGIVTPHTLPEQLTTQMAEQLTPFADDLNGDGKTVVAVEVYTLAPPTGGEAGSESGGSALAGEDIYSQMAGITRLTSALSDTEQFIFLFAPDEAQAYQDAYQIFGTAAGTLAPEGTDVNTISVAFEDCPGLASLDLSYTDWDDSEVNGQQILAKYRVGLRPLTGTDANKEKGAERYQACKNLLDVLTGA